MRKPVWLFALFLCVMALPAHAQVNGGGLAGGCQFGSTAGTCVQGNGGTIGGPLTVQGQMTTEGALTHSTNSNTIQTVNLNLSTDIVTSAGSNAIFIGTQDELATLNGSGTIVSGHDIAHFSLFNNNGGLTMPLGIADEASVINNGGNMTAVDGYIFHLNGNTGTIGSLVVYGMAQMDSNTGGTVSSLLVFSCPNLAGYTGTLTARKCLENDDPGQAITSVGPVTLGDGTANAPSFMLNTPSGGNGLITYQIGGTQTITDGITSGTADDTVFWNGSTPTFVPKACVIATGVCDYGSGTDTEIGNNSVTASATTGFIGLPSGTAASTATPTNASFGPMCYVNTSSGNLNCYYGGAWHHVAFAAGAE